MRLPILLVLLLLVAGCATPAPAEEPPRASPGDAAAPTTGVANASPSAGALATTPAAAAPPTPTPAPPAPATPSPLVATPSPPPPPPPTPAPAGNPAASGSGPYAPNVSAADFEPGGRIDHPFLPLRPGSRYVYEATEDGEVEIITITVLAQTRQIMGVVATIVRDTVTDEDGELVEDTYDWFAQDKTGNVWYLGEDTTEYEDGRAVTKEGSWEWGTDGALPGILLPARLEPGSGPFYMEYLPGEAVDQSEVVALGENVTIPFGTYDETVRTREWTALEPGVSEFAVYVRGIGLVRKWHDGSDEAEVLVEYVLGPN